MVIHGNEDNFDQVISDELVLVDFFATWCGPCKMLGPVLEELSSSRNAIKVVKVDVDECPDLARKYGVMSVPTMLLFKNGTLITTNSGYMPLSLLEDWINENK